MLEIHKVKFTNMYAKMENKKKNKQAFYIILKFLIILIPLIFIEFIFYSNFIANHDFNYVYDIGYEEENYLSPIARISEQLSDSSNLNLNYRSLTDQLVYFDVPISMYADNVNITIKFKDNFPENTKFSLGAKDQEEWHYQYNLLYNPTIEKLMEKYPYQTKNGLVLIKINRNIPNYVIDDFLKDPLPLVKLATDRDIIISEFKILNYQPSEFIINTALRKSPTFYIYSKGDFEAKIWKRDLNWYDNEDILNISLYDLDDNLIANEIIEDDGEEDKESNKDDEDEQKGNLFVSNLKEGVYKLELENNDDMLITKIKLNQNKIVLYKKVFLAQNDIYFNDFEEKSYLYFKTPKDIKLIVQTWHDEGIQTIYVNKGILKIRKKIEEYHLDILASNDFYELVSKKNDIKIKGPEFFAFSEESWFNPFEGKNIKYKNDIDYLENNADFVLVKYTPTKYQGNDWRIATTSFNLKDLYIKDGKLSMTFNAPHLNAKKNETNQMYIPIDWINITVHKPGLLK